MQQKSSTRKDPAIEHPATHCDPVLQVDGLCFGYPQRTLFTGLSARVPSGVSLVRGGDGAGKTTLLELLAGARPAHAGQLQVNGVSLASQPDAYRQQVFWADPRADAADPMTPRGYFSTLPTVQQRFDAVALEDLVQGLGLAPHLDKGLFMLSTGTRRKVWLAAAFASGAPVTLLDQPFAALDKTSIDFVTELLQDVADHSARAWIVADYAAPGKVPLAAVIDLGD